MRKASLKITEVVIDAGGGLKMKRTLLEMEGVAFDRAGRVQKRRFWRQLFFVNGLFRSVPKAIFETRGCRLLLFAEVLFALHGTSGSANRR